MLSIGDSKISKLFLGGTECKRAYLGDTMVFGAEDKPSRLPGGYTEVEYIDVAECTGFNTNITINPSTFRLEMELAVHERKTSAEYIFRCMPSFDYKADWYRYSDTELRFHIARSSFVGVVSIGFPIDEKTSLEIDWAKRKISIGDVSETISSNNSFTSGTLYLFCSGGSSYRCLPCKLYSAKTYNGNILSGDYVPCVEDSTGEAGLYNIKSNVFLRNAYSDYGTVTAGPAV